MIRVAVSGRGRWGPYHIRNFSTLPGSKFVAVVDVDAARLAPIRELYPRARYGTDAREVLADDGVDAVVVATPTSTHYQKVQNRSFLEAIRSGAVERSDGPFSLGVVKVLEAMTASLRLGGSAVQVSALD